MLSTTVLIKYSQDYKYLKMGLCIEYLYKPKIGSTRNFYKKQTEIEILQVTSIDVTLKIQFFILWFYYAYN